MRGKKLCALTGAGLALTFSLVGCSPNGSELQDERVDETSQLQDLNAEGTIKMPFKVAPSLQSKAVAQSKQVSDVLDVSNQGVLGVSSDGSRLYRILNGKIAWSSEVMTGTHVSAKFVMDKSRLWIVEIRDSGDGMEIYVFDASSSAENQASLRKKDVGKVGIMFNRNGLILNAGKGDYQGYKPSNGLTYKVSAEKGASITAPAIDGVFVVKDKRVSLSADGTGGWNGMSQTPEGMTDKAESTMIGYSSSYIATQWTEGDKRVLAIQKASDGTIVAEQDISQEDEYTNAANTAIRGSQNDSYVYSQNFVADVSTGKISLYEDTVTGVNDGIVYLENGRGYDAKTSEKMWSDANAGAPVSIFIQRHAVIVKDDTMYLVNVKFDEKIEEDGTDE